MLEVATEAAVGVVVVTLAVVIPEASAAAPPLPMMLLLRDAAAGFLMAVVVLLFPCNSRLLTISICCKRDPPLNPKDMMMMIVNALPCACAAVKVYLYMIAKVHKNMRANARQ